MSEDHEFVDPESYRGSKEEISFKTIVLEHVRRCVHLGSTELRQGQQQAVQGAGGQYIMGYQPSTEQSFCNAVDALEALIMPQFSKEESIEGTNFFLAKQDLKRYCIMRTKESQHKNFNLYYNPNFLQLQWKKFYWLLRVLHRLNYMNAGSYEEVL